MLQYIAELQVIIKGQLFHAQVNLAVI